MSSFDQKNQKVNTQLNADKINIDLKSITCPNCQQGNPPKAKFCSECGASLLFKCPICNSETPLSGKFCSGCGKEINTIFADIEEAKSRRGGNNRELVYEFRTKARDSFSVISHLATLKLDARMTLEVDEYITMQENGIELYKSGTSKKEAEGVLYLTNKRLIFLGCDSEDRMVPYADTYLFSEISEASSEIEKLLFLSISSLKIIWKGNIKKFSFTNNVGEAWAKAIHAKLLFNASRFPTKTG